MGLSCQDLNAKLALQLNLYVNQGVLINEITPDGPAARAGLKHGDVIVQVGPHRVTGCDEIAALLQGSNPGEDVDVQIVRDQYVARTRVAVR